MLWLDPTLGALTLSVVPILFIMRIIWLPLARKAFLAAREASSATNGALSENVHGIRAIQELVREDVNFELFEKKAKTIFWPISALRNSAMSLSQWSTH